MRAFEAEPVVDNEADLARANLLRIRGDYQGAEALALSILKRDPESITGHTLLGDINVEKGDLEQAQQWYELALDLDPTSAADVQKLAAVETRIAERDAARTAERLGLPSAKNNLVVALVGLGLFVVLVGLIAYLLGQQFQRQRDRAPTFQTVMEAPPGQVEPPEPVPPAPVVRTEEERALMAALGLAGERVAAVEVDPRDRALRLTLSLQGTEDSASLSQETGRLALEASPESPRATVRVLREGALVYVADVVRGQDSLTMENVWEPGR
jgi:tetratricopeptide (TPR) repeat protein